MAQHKPQDPISTSDFGSFPGARWWRFDFHTHTPASTDYGKGPDQAALMQITPEEWLLNFMRAGIDCVAVTDHNSGDWVDQLKSALDRLCEQQHADYRPLTLFPGVEITASGGTHILAIFDPNKQSSDITRLLGEVSYKGAFGESHIAARAAPEEVVRKIVDADALPILAHVDARSGAWELAGNTLTPLLECEDLFAIEVVDASTAKPSLYRQKKLQWAEVLGSDAHHPSGPSGTRYPGSHWTWVKMARPSLEGLRLALLDGAGFSVRRSDDPEPFDPQDLPENYIESVQIDSACYMGRGQPEAFDFSPWLNALVGGRGTGKSTVVHALRLALRREHELTALEEGSEARRTFEKFSRVAQGGNAQGALTTVTHITMTFVRDKHRYRVHWRLSGQGAAVEEYIDGEWCESQHQTVTPSRFPARLFSQGQIAALANGNHQALLDLIDEAANVDAEKTAIREGQQAYLSFCANARELEGRLQGWEPLKIQLEDVQRKLNKFEEAHHADVLKTYQRRARQEREIKRQFASVDDMTAHINALAEEVTAEDIPEQLFDKQDANDQDALALIENLQTAVDVARKALQAAAADLDACVNQQRQSLPNTRWQQAYSQGRSDYEQLVQALKEQGVADPSEYGQLVQQRQKLELQWQEFEALEAKREQLLEKAQAQHTTVLEARRALSQKRQTFLQENLAGNDYVQISLKPYSSDAQPLERSLRELLGAESQRFESDIFQEQEGQPAKGIVAELVARSTDGKMDFEQTIEEVKQRLGNACHGHGGFGGHFNRFLKRKADSHPEFIDHLMMWWPSDGLDVRYSQKGDGQNFKPIEQASAGQRAAAMLAFLLAYGTDPIVLDQPEDDLDNHLIYSLVVQQLRANKQRRQIITVTHNPNIVVNGDAEMLHALDFRSGQCRVTQKGSLQEKAMRDEVCKIMEGGRDAFERRYRRLGKEI
jgi:energy-coupling factor transporter ATP-binding protein EcfA2